jgi:putative transcriptional regulator
MYKGRTIPKLTIDKTAALCQLYQCSIEELAEAVMESMRQENTDTNIELDETSDR